MTQQTLLLVEATGIQEYIFGSNQLAQNIGASELVQLATTNWVYEALPDDHNVKRAAEKPDGWIIENRSLAGDGLAAEVVYAGGGNAMILFADDDEAEKFARRLTRTILEDAPGLGVVLKRQGFDPDGEALAQIHQDLRKALALRKLDRPRSVPLLGLGVTAACVFTGEPAVGLDDERRLISAEVRAKLCAEEDGKERLKRHLRDIELAGYDFIYDFDELGSKGTASYLAVIHTDGNNMGKRIRRIGKECPSPADNAVYVRKLRKFSSSVARAARAALNSTVGMLLAPANLIEGKLGGIVPIPAKDGQDLLPFRPIVFGGDDVTFVCDGRLGLEVAAKYLHEFTTQPLDDGEPAYARAGVAVVKTHYPFSRAYDLAEELCKSAKQYIKKWEDEGEEGITALDWHFAVGGLVLPLGEVRRREYTVEKDVSLLMRPLHLGHPASDWRSWQTFTRLMDEFQDKRGDWYGRRNKVKALRDALRAGPDAVKVFVQTVGQPLPPIPQRPEMKNQGWQGKECGYFDAVEALDFYVRLEGGFAA
jgi:hypothetical protein